MIENVDAVLIANFSALIDEPAGLLLKALWL